MENASKSLLVIKDTIIEETNLVINTTSSVQEKEEASRIANIFETLISMLLNKDVENKIKTKEYIVDTINTIDSSSFDTESKEYIVDKFTNIAEVIAIDIAEPLTIWLYGRVLGKMIISNRPDEESARVLKRNCSNCDREFSFIIKSIDNSIPDFWHIVECESCNTRNVISLRPGIKDMRFKNCFPINSFNKQDYTLEQIVSLI